LAVGRRDSYHNSPYSQSSLDSDSTALFYVGSDSRVPESIVLDSKTPGEIFVHRNIANTFSGADDSCHSVLEYGVGHLDIKHGTCGIL
jgi:carbonic anhydrase